MSLTEYLHGLDEPQLQTALRIIQERIKEKENESKEKLWSVGSYDLNLAWFKDADKDKAIEKACELLKTDLDSLECNKGRYRLEISRQYIPKSEVSDYLKD